MRRTALLLFPALLSLAFAPAPLPKPDPSKADLKRMQGEWVLVRYASGESPLPVPGGIRVVYLEPTKMVVSGGRVDRYYHALGARPVSWALTLDGRRAPKLLVWDQNPALAQCIYRLDGDTLTLCYHEKVRPVSFGPAGPGVTLEVWKRPKR